MGAKISGRSKPLEKVLTKFCMGMTKTDEFLRIVFLKRETK
jgi:hypothetical protein